MKPLPPEVTTGLAHVVQEPTYLIEIELDEKMYLSTQKEYDTGTQIYTPGKVQGLQVSIERASFGLVNEGFRHTTPALTGVYQRAPVSIYWTQGEDRPHPIVDDGYFAEGYYDWDSRVAPMLVFQGNVTEFSQITSILGVVATRSAARHFPAKRVLPPIANFVRPEGTVFQFGSYTFRLEPRD